MEPASGLVSDRMQLCNHTLCNSHFRLRENGGSRICSADPRFVRVCGFCVLDRRTLNAMPSDQQARLQQTGKSAGLLQVHRA